LLASHAARGQEVGPLFTVGPDATLESLPPIAGTTPEEIDLGPAASDAVSAPEIAPVIEEIVVPPKIWTGSVELGSSGTDGNSQSFQLTFGAKLARKVPTSELTLDLTYNFNHSESVNIANRLFTEERYEWLFVDSPWTLYVHQTNEFDEFRPFDVRVTGDAGWGYKFFDSEPLKFATRIGAGVSHEIGGPDDEVVPEGVWGWTFERKLWARHSCSASLDYFPDFTDPGDFRVNSRADWQVVLNDAESLSLKLGLVDRYDSTPAGGRRNDLNYSLLLLYSF
jgi:putative salt-induced outer membrane protein YdiY